MNFSLSCINLIEKNHDFYDVVETVKENMKFFEVDKLGGEHAKKIGLEDIVVIAGEVMT